MTTPLFALLLSSAALAAPEMIPESALEIVGSAASDFKLPLRDGGEFALSEHRGKTVVLSFWASWCTPCQRELPALADFAKEHKDLVVIAVNVDREREDAESFLSRVSFALPIAFDNEALALGAFDVTSMPTMFVVDPIGVVRFRKSGFSPEKGFTELMGALDEMKNRK